MLSFVCRLHAEEAKGLIVFDDGSHSHDYSTAFEYTSLEAFPLTYLAVKTSGLQYSGISAQVVVRLDYSVVSGEQLKKMETAAKTFINAAPLLKPRIASLKKTLENMPTPAQAVATPPPAAAMSLGKKSFTDVKPVKIEDGMLRFMHDGGLGRVPVAEIPQKSLQALGNLRPELREAPEFQEAMSSFMPSILIHNTTYSAVKLLSSKDDALLLTTDAGPLQCKVSDLPPGALATLTATPTKRVPPPAAPDPATTAAPANTAPSFRTPNSAPPRQMPSSPALITDHLPKPKEPRESGTPPPKSAGPEAPAAESKPPVARAASEMVYNDLGKEELVPQPAPKQPPAKSSSAELAPEFVTYMLCTGDPCTPHRTRAESISVVRSPEKWVAALLKVSDSTNPAVDALIKKVQKNAANILNADQSRKDYVADSDANFQDLRERAGRGEITETWVNGLGGRRTVDVGGGAVVSGLLGNLFTHIMQGSVADHILGTLDEQLARCRLEGLLELPAQLPKIYPASPALPQMIQFIPSKESWGFKNVSGRDLHHLTLYVEAVLPISAPNPTIACAVYIDRLTTDDTFHVNPNRDRNLYDKAWREGKEGLPISIQQRAEGESNWYNQTSGIVETRIHAWALEAHCAPQVLRYPDQGLRAAPFELELIGEVIGTAAANQEQGVKTAAATWATATAQRVMTYVPKNSEMAVKAWKVVSSPWAGAAAYQTRAGEHLLGQFGGHLEGTYHWGYGDRLSRSGPARSPGEKTCWEREDSIKARNGDGKIAMDIVGVTKDHKFRIVMYNPERPTAKRPFLGVLDRDHDEVRMRCTPERDEGLPGPNTAPLNQCAASFDLVYAGSKVTGFVRTSQENFDLNLRREKR